MPNRLASSSSPYLLQHQDNPVDWYEWGEEAFVAARDRDKPILLSVGYSACHWCHVMAHESFEDDETAALMNDHFVNIKVDREERPDVDRIYMDAVQAMTGRGGWPMTVFLTPEGKPFFAGTYFPKVDHHGMPSFRRVLTGMSQAWNDHRTDITEQADRLTVAISASIPAGDVDVSALAGRGYEALAQQFDAEHGGFGGAPKFPQAPSLELLLRMAGDGRAPDAAPMLSTTLGTMAAGGIYDHVGGGFARYAVDRIWLVPHFEKMLYDNALLARIYLRAFQVLDGPQWRDVAVETLDYILRDLRHPDGGFYSAEDADSEGVEGKFYVWSAAEFDEVAGADAAAGRAVFGVTDEGNFEGSNILVRRRGDQADPELVRRLTSALRERRQQRVRPGLDDKVITAWNGFALRSFAEAAAVLDSERYLNAAVANAHFVLTNLKRQDGRLLRSWRDGSASIPAFCDDYAAYAIGLFTLYQVTGDVEWYEAAAELVVEMHRLFADPSGGYFATGTDAERLITRPKNWMDNPTPADNTLAVEALLLYTGFAGPTATPGLEEIERTASAAGVLLDRYPTAAAHLVAVLDTMAQGTSEVAIVGEPAQPFTDVVWSLFLPGTVLAKTGEPSSQPPILAGRDTIDEVPTAYVCRGFTCDLPTTDPEVMSRQLLAPGGRKGG